MKNRVKTFLSEKFISILIYVFGCFFALLLSISVSNMFFVNESTRCSYTLMSKMEGNVTLKISDSTKSNSIIWKYDWFAGYDLAYHYAAKNTKVTFSSRLEEWDFFINDVSVDGISDFISTSSRIHEYKGQYYGDYLSLNVIKGVDWKDYGGENDIYISEKTYNEYFNSVDQEDFLFNNPVLKLQKNEKHFEYKIVGIISNDSLKTYSDIYDNVIFGSTKALTYNGFDNHYLDIMAFAYDVQGWETEFSYLFQRIGAIGSDVCNYEYSTMNNLICLFTAVSKQSLPLIILIAIGSSGILASFVLSVLLKCIKKIELKFVVFSACLVTFLSFAFAMIFSKTIFSNLNIIIDNYSSFFLYLLFSIIVIVTISLLLNKKNNDKFFNFSGQYYEVDI